MKNVVLQGQLRDQIGKKGSKAYRNEELIPCVLYGGKENIHFLLNEKELRSVVYTPDFHTVELHINGKSYISILKELQFHPVSEKMLHIDFLELVNDKKVIVELPVRLRGNAVGVRAGGRLLQKVRKLKVKTIPQNLVDEINLNIDDLDVGKSIRVKNVVLEGVQIMQPAEVPIATVEITRALKSAKAEEAKEAKGKKKK